MHIQLNYSCHRKELVFAHDLRESFSVMTPPLTCKQFQDDKWDYVSRLENSATAYANYKLLTLGPNGSNFKLLMKAITSYIQ